MTIWLATVALAADDRQAPPNIVVILADDLGLGDLECYGHPTFRTPRLNALAKSGVRFTEFQTPMPFCAPTRAALLTGRYPLRCGLSVNPAPDANPAADQVGLPLTERTLADFLRERGYVAACIGKWHLGHKPHFAAIRRGFDRYFGIPYSNDMRPVILVDQDQTVEYPVVQATLVRRLTERAAAFIDENKNRPFFLYFAHPMPHKPLAASERFYGKSGAGLYGDVIAEFDWSVGEVLDALERNGLRSNTLVVFTSDNGPWFGGSTAGLRGMKSTSWQGGYRVPAIVSWPGKLPASRECHRPAITMDIFATAMEAAGVDLPAGLFIDGKSLLPLCRQPDSTHHDLIFGQVGPTLANVRMGRWKLHVAAPRTEKFLKPGDPWNDPRGPDGVTILAPFAQAHPSQYPGLKTGDGPRPMMLFDLEADPGEQHDVAAANPEIVARLKASFDAKSLELKPDSQPRPSP